MNVRKLHVVNASAPSSCQFLLSILELPIVGLCCVLHGSVSTCPLAQSPHLSFESQIGLKSSRDHILSGRQTFRRHKATNDRNVRPRDEIRYFESDHQSALPTSATDTLNTIIGLVLTRMASSSAHTPECFASALSKVRRLSISSLPHQSRPAQLLVALEATVFGNSDVTPGAHNASAYLDALLQCLQRAYPDEGKMEIMGLGAVIPATLYLLAIVVPETPTRELLSKISPLLECLLPLYPTALEQPPAIRSLLQITTFVLVVAPPALLNSSPLLKKAWNHLLGLNLDPRPKVRHLAQEGVRQVLCTPVPPRTSAGAHPYLPRARGWVTSVLEEEAKSGGTSSKGKKARLADGEDAEGKRAIWVVQGLRGWIAVWGNQVSRSSKRIAEYADRRRSTSRSSARYCCPCHFSPISPRKSTPSSPICSRRRQTTLLAPNHQPLQTFQPSWTRYCHHHRRSSRTPRTSRRICLLSHRHSSRCPYKTR